MRRFLVAVIAIGFAIATQAAMATQDYVYQGPVATPGTVEAMAPTRTGDLAVAYSTPTGSSVAVFDNNGKKLKTIALPKLKVSSMAVDKLGRFVFLGCTSGSQCISIYDSTGHHLISKQAEWPDTADSFPYFNGITIGVNNSIIYSIYLGGEVTCNGGYAYIYTQRLKFLSSFSIPGHCISGMTALGNNLLVAAIDESTYDSALTVTDYGGNAVSAFGDGLSQVKGPITSSVGQNRLFFDIGVNPLGRGIGVFDATGKRLQFVPFPTDNFTGLTSTTAGYFYIANPYPVLGLERFGPGTPPPPPVAKNATATVQPGNSVSINVPATNGPFEYLTVTQPSGTAYVTSLNTIQYTARSSLGDIITGTDSFSYTVWNSTGKSTATVTVTITPQAPVAGPAQTVTTSKTTAVSVNVTANAQNGPFTSVAVATPPAHGKAVPNKLNIVYTPAAGFTGQDGFTYTITNSGGASAPGQVNVLVGG